jgi:hypothetical protein
VTVYDALARYLGGVDWPIRADPGTGFSFPATGEYGTFLVQIVAHEELPGALVYALHPEPVPRDALTDAAVLIARLNDGLPIGNFELDHDTGDVRVKASAEVPGDQLTDTIAAGLVQAVVALMDRYYPAVSALASGADAEQALAAAEA